MKNQLADSIHMDFNDNIVLSSLFGVSDSIIQLLEKIIYENDSTYSSITVASLLFC